MRGVSHDDNLSLIGMPGAGKSTVGVLLAKAVRREFLDTDVIMQVRAGRGLQDILDAEGLEGFCRIEQQCVLDLHLHGHVIATGGSVVYSPAAMEHLRSGGPIVHLDLPLDLLERRLASLATRGVVMEPGQSLRDLYERRRPLYLRWADRTVVCTGLTQDQVAAAIQRALGL